MTFDLLALGAIALFALWGAFTDFARHVAQAADTIGRARLVLAQLEVPTAAILHGFELARAAGVTTALNAAPAPERVDAELLAATDLLFVNEGEGAALSGVADVETLRHVAAAALTDGARPAFVYASVVVALGAVLSFLIPRVEPHPPIPPEDFEPLETDELLEMI